MRRHLLIRSICIAALLMVCFTAHAAFGAPAFAAKQTTYIASQNIYQNSSMTVYLKGNQMICRSASGQKKVLLNNIAESYSKQKGGAIESDIQFFVRGKTVYFSETPVDQVSYRLYPARRNIWSVNANGTKKLIMKNAGWIIGGYGSDIIVMKNADGARDHGTVYRISGKKAKKLFKANSEVLLYDGRLFYDNKSYNLDTKVVKKFTPKSDFATKKYLYYVNGKYKLVRLQNSKRVFFQVRYVSRIIGGDDAGNVIYMGKNSSGAMTFYRITASGKAYQLATQAALLNAAGAGHMKVARYSAAVAGGKVCIGIHGNSRSYIVSVPATGGQIRAEETTGALWSMEASGKTIYYTTGGSDRSTHILYRSKTIR